MAENKELESFRIELDTLTKERDGLSQKATHKALNLLKMADTLLDDYRKSFTINRVEIDKIRDWKGKYTQFFSLEADCILLNQRIDQLDKFLNNKKGT